jgi:hypothetical protein
MAWRSELRIDEHDDRTRPHVEAELFSRQVGRLLAACLSGISHWTAKTEEPLMGALYATQRIWSRYFPG